MPKPKKTQHTEEVEEIFHKIGTRKMEQIALEGFQAAALIFLNDVFAKFGRWSLYGILAMFITLITGACIFGFVWLNGWRPH